MKVFVDFDDTLARSSETVVKYLNQKYGLNKTADDVHDWCFRSIWKYMNPLLVEIIFASDFFWSDIRLFDKAVDVLRGHEVTLCTCGSKKNLECKRKFIADNNLGYAEAFVDISDGTKSGKDKRDFDMAGAIQIDDRVDSLLYTNAAVKILFKNGHNHTWQIVPAGSGIYAVDTWDEIEEIVRWFNDNQSLPAYR